MLVTAGPDAAYSITIVSAAERSNHPITGLRSSDQAKITASEPARTEVALFCATTTFMPSHHHETGGMP
jgi:hypothetical protein